MSIIGSSKLGWRMRQVAVGSLSISAAKVAFGPKSFVSRQKETLPTVYLTFDDGPSVLCDQILSLLKQFDAKATFFLRGDRAAAAPHTVMNILADGHAIGNHTFSHPDPWRVGKKSIWSELDQCEAILDTFGPREKKLMRPPYGRLNRHQLEWCTKNSVVPVLWDVLPGDYDSRVEVGPAVNYCLKAIKPGSVVVLHDNERRSTRRVTLPILEAVLTQLASKKWSFKAI